MGFSVMSTAAHCHTSDAAQPADGQHHSGADRRPVKTVPSRRPHAATARAPQKTFVVAFGRTTSLSSVPAVPYTHPGKAHRAAQKPGHSGQNSNSTYAFGSTTRRDQTVTARAVPNKKSNKALIDSIRPKDPKKLGSKTASTERLGFGSSTSYLAPSRLIQQPATFGERFERLKNHPRETFTRV